VCVRLFKLVNRIKKKEETIYYLEDKIQPSKIENLPIQLNLSFQYDEKNLHIMIYGARNIPIQHGLLACQLVLQYERDIL